MLLHFITFGNWYILIYLPALYFQRKKTRQHMFTIEDFQKIKTRNDLVKIAGRKGMDLKKPLRNQRYEEELKTLQAEMVNLQRWIAQKSMRVVIIFEGRDAAGKGGSIKRFREHLNPRSSEGGSTGQTLRSRARTMVF